MMKKVSFNIGGVALEYEVNGDTVYGEDKVLLEEDDNLIANTYWAKQGYTVERLFPMEETKSLRNELRKKVLTVVQKVTSVSEDSFDLEKYHTYVNDNTHREITSILRKGFSTSEFPGGMERLENRISEICGVRVVSKCAVSEGDGFFVRVVRPFSETDNNPPHRDVWLDRLRNCVNIYFPLAGSDENSALPIVPGSHLWSESEIERTASGAKIKDAVYQVPSVVGWKKSLELVRPNPQGDDVMVFSPYAIHGGGVNLNQEKTRMSLEVRFWRK